MKRAFKILQYVLTLCVLLCCTSWTINATPLTIVKVDCAQDFGVVATSVYFSADGNDSGKLNLPTRQAEIDTVTLDAVGNESGDSFIQRIIQRPWVIWFTAFVIAVVCVILCEVLSEKKQKALSTIINVDSMTGLMTEAKFVAEARKLLQQNPNDSYRIVVFDIDNFKYVNEIYGYKTGSALLKIVAEQLQMIEDNNQEQDDKQRLIGRGAGDHFLVLAPAASYSETCNQLQTHIEGVRRELNVLLGKSYKLYFSVGIYDVHSRDIDITQMIDYANIARQQGKVRAGNSICTFTPAMKIERQRNNEFTSIMEQALADEEFVLFYQPKVHMKTGVLAGAEALVRWERACVCMPPYQFIPLFEKNGFIEQLDYYVLAKVCRFLQIHPNLIDGRLSVNLSGISMIQPNIVQNLIAITERYSVRPNQLDIEITETAFVDTSSVHDKIEQLRQYGFTISMDDFGVGGSSLNRLKNIQVDTLKIDREFVNDALENERGRKILHHVVEMATDLNLEIVAEGIETLAQHQLLETLGCDIGQGYYYARPMAEKDFEAFCKNHSITK